MAPKFHFQNQPRILQASRGKVITIDDSSQGRRFAVTLAAAALVLLTLISDSELRTPKIFRPHRNKPMTAGKNGLPISMRPTLPGRQQLTRAGHPVARSAKRCRKTTWK